VGGERHPAVAARLVVVDFAEGGEGVEVVAFPDGGEAVEVREQYLFVAWDSGAEVAGVVAAAETLLGLEMPLVDLVKIAWPAR